MASKRETNRKWEYKNKVINQLIFGDFWQLNGQIRSLSLVSTLKEFDFGLATWRMTIGDFGRDGHMARANWVKTCSFDRAWEDSGPTCTNGARRMVKKAERGQAVTH